MDFTEKLIAEIKVRPVIWNRKSIAYKDVRARKAWKEVAETLHTSIERCQKGFIPLRYNFAKELKNCHPSSDGTGYVYEGQWVFFNALSFLYDVTPSIKSRKDVPDSSTVDDHAMELYHGPFDISITKSTKPFGWKYEKLISGVGIKIVHVDLKSQALRNGLYPDCIVTNIHDKVQGKDLEFSAEDFDQQFTELTELLMSFKKPTNDLGYVRKSRRSKGDSMSIGKEEEFEVSITKNKTPMGWIIKMLDIGSGIEVKEIYKFGYAGRSGIRPGDVIIKAYDCACGEYLNLDNERLDQQFTDLKELRFTIKRITLRYNPSKSLEDAEEKQRLRCLSNRRRREFQLNLERELVLAKREKQRKEQYQLELENRHLMNEQPVFNSTRSLWKEHIFKLAKIRGQNKIVEFHEIFIIKKKPLGWTIETSSTTLGVKVVDVVYNGVAWDYGIKPFDIVTKVYDKIGRYFLNIFADDFAEQCDKLTSFLVSLRRVKDESIDNEIKEMENLQLAAMRNKERQGNFNYATRSDSSEITFIEEVIQNETTIKPKSRNNFDLSKETSNVEPMDWNKAFRAIRTESIEDSAETAISIIVTPAHKPSVDTSISYSPLEPNLSRSSSSFHNVGNIRDTVAQEVSNFIKQSSEILHGEKCLNANNSDIDCMVIDDLKELNELPVSNLTHQQPALTASEKSLSENLAILLDKRFEMETKLKNIEQQNRSIQIEIETTLARKEKYQTNVEKIDLKNLELIRLLKNRCVDESLV